MKKRTLSKIVASAAIAAISVTTSFAQLNLGADCGCPAVGSRPTKNLSTLTDGNQELIANKTLTCDTTWIIDQKIYVPNGKTLTIMPGTLIKGVYVVDPNNASALIIERGGKINARGTANCPIVMTGNADPMDGTYSMTNVGDWGGLVIAGIANNNLIVGNSLCVGIAGVGKMEGFSAADATSRVYFGAGVGDPAGFTTPDDNDNSGVLQYVSVRHAGALIGSSSAGNELNGISLYSVGRGTTIDHCETVAAADDNFEFFGGTVDVKYLSVLYGDDDFYDYDLGYSGRMQFLFGIAGDTVTGLHTTDNGFECDADDNSKAPTLRSHPLVYNCTLIGNGHINPSADNTGPAAIQAKELTEGEFYNNVFVNFRSGLHLATSRSNSTNKGDAYDNWTDNTGDVYLTSNGGKAIYHSLKVKNNTFIGAMKLVTGPSMPDSIKSGYMTLKRLTKGKNPAYFAYGLAPSASDTVQFLTTDKNAYVPSVYGIDYTWSWNAGHTGFTNTYCAVPFANISTDVTAPNDGWFSAVKYRGAFDATQQSWLSAANGFTAPFQRLQDANRTDINQDGVTDINDFLLLSGKFGVVDSK
jgi:hypothetical protein